MYFKLLWSRAPPSVCRQVLFALAVRMPSPSEQQLNPNWAPDHKFARWFHLYEAVLKNTTQEVAEENGVPVYIQAPQSTLF